MFRPSNQVLFTNIYLQAIDKLRAIGHISTRYKSRLAEKMEYEDYEHAETLLRIMKHDLILICELLRSLRINQSEAFKNKYYYKLISKESTDPIDVIRHGIVHLDPYIRSSIKFDFYQIALKSMVEFALFKKDDDHETATTFQNYSIPPLSFEELKATDLYKEFLITREKSKQMPVVIHKKALDNEVAKRLVEYFDFIVTLMPQEFSEKSKKSMIAFRAQHRALFVAIAEIGEILSQTKNLYEKLNNNPGKQKDDYTIYLNVGNCKVWLPTDTINAFIEMRKSLSHHNMYDSYLTETHAAIDFVNTTYSRAKMSAARIKQ